MTMILEAITEAGSDGIPSGHLYSMLMGTISLEIYQSIIDALVKAKEITNKGHLLKVAI